MKKEFVMRGQTASGYTEVLNFSGYKPGYAYRLTEFKLFGSTSLGTAFAELWGTVTAGKTAVAPTDPNFNDDGLIAVSQYATNINASGGSATAFPVNNEIINNTFLITQNLILMVQDTGTAGNPINWQCRFESVKMTGPEEASVNYKQFAISDE